MNREKLRPINSTCLPREMLMEIFSYLTNDDISRAGRVCKIWHEVAKDPIIWKKVDACVKSPNEAVKLIRLLPKCVTHLRICCDSLDVRLPLWFPDIAAALRNNCPNLEILIIEKVFFQMQPCDVCIRVQDKKKFYPGFHFRELECIDLDNVGLFCMSCTIERNKDQFSPEYLPEKLHVLSLRDSLFIASHFASRLDVLIPQIKVLDMSPSLCISEDITPFFYRLINLRELYLMRCPVTSKGLEQLLKTVQGLRILDLENTGICSRSFLTLKIYGRSLEELYVGGTLVEDSCLTYKVENSFEHLRVLCLRGTCVSPPGLVELLDLYPHLYSVNVSKCNVAKIWAEKHYFYMHEKLIFKNNVHCDHFRQNKHYMKF